MVLLSKVQVVELYGSYDRKSVPEVLRRAESVVTGMAKEYIEKEAFIRRYRDLYCKDCSRRIGIKNGKMRVLYEIGDAPCRTCEVDDMLDAVDDWPAANVREVVLCKWCSLHTHCRTEDIFDLAGLREENRFCSVGKRKVNGAQMGGAEDA